MIWGRSDETLLAYIEAYVEAGFRLKAAMFAFSTLFNSCVADTVRVLRTGAMSVDGVYEFEDADKIKQSVNLLHYLCGHCQCFRDELIQECLAMGADVNAVSTGKSKTPLAFVVQKQVFTRYKTS